MASDLLFDIFPKRQRELFDSLSKLDWISSFYLAGGTALALQIGHRRSIDFDFFAAKAFDVEVVRNKLLKLGNYELSAKSEQILEGRLNSVRIAFFNLTYPLVGKEISFGNIKIVSKADIAAMKLAALSTR